MSKIGLVIQREYLTRVRKKSFIIMTLLGPLLIAGAFIAIIWLSMSESDRQNVLVLDETEGFYSELKDSEVVTYDYTSSLTLDGAKDKLKGNDYTSLLYLPKNVVNSNTAILYFKNQPGGKSRKMIEADIEGITEAYKLDNLYREMEIDESKFAKEDFYRIKTAINLRTFKFKESGEEEEIFTESAYIGLAFSIMIYFFIFLYSVQVMRGVAEEKSSRIVEVIISSIKPFQLMMGKIIGVALVGLTQFLLWVVLSTAVMTIASSVMFDQAWDPTQVAMQQQATQEVMQDIQTDAIKDGFDLNDPNNVLNRINFPLMLGMFLFYFLGGYFLYSALFAAVGSAIDQETDSQQFVLPITLPLLLAYATSFTVVENPEGPLAFWFSIIPFTSPVTMMIRVALGFEIGDLWQLFLSMALLVATFVLITWLAARIYRVGILMYGKKINYKELWKWLFYTN